MLAVRKLFLLVALCFSLITPPSHAGVCEKALNLSKTAWATTKAVANDIRQHPLVRPFNEDQIKPRWFGVSPVVEKQGFLRWTFRSLPLKVFGSKASKAYELTPMDSLYHHTVRRPVGWLSQKLLGKAFEPACIPKFAIMMAAGTCIAITASWGTFETIHAVKFNLEKSEIARLIHDDFRYFDIDSARQTAGLKQEDALKVAYARRANLGSYYTALILSNESPFFDSEQRFDFIYSDLYGVLLNGIPEKLEGFEIPPESAGPLSAEKKMKLIYLQDALYIGYKVIAEYYVDPNSAQSLRNPAGESLYKFLTENQLMKQLHDSYVKGEIPLESALRKSQEYYFWIITYRKYEVIGVKKLISLEEQITKENQVP